MLSTGDIDKLIAVKKREIAREKTLLGLEPSLGSHEIIEDYKENGEFSRSKKVNFTENRKLPKRDVAVHESTEVKNETYDKKSLYELEEKIPPDLERYIRRCVGLPVMLKAGEFSPNNPLIRGERTSGDVLLGLGEYERRRNTLRKIRQQQYKEYLDEQAKKKQEAKEQAEKERREREEKDREHEERERERLHVERERYSPERRASLNHVPSTIAPYSSKVDTAVQVNGVNRPLSVAVQTEDTDLFRITPSPSNGLLTQAERELSPRTVLESKDDRQMRPAQWTAAYTKTDNPCERRRSYGDFDERTSTLVKKSNRDKLVSDLRHTYMPSIFDADAIELRNIQAVKDAAAKRQFYQQELKNQILEQQRIREERKSREKMLEQAEMRRLEEQLRMLKCAQDREVGRHYDLTAAMKQSATDYDYKRTELQREIDKEQQKLLRATCQTTRMVKRNTDTSRSDPQHSKVPMYYPRILEKNSGFDANLKTNQEKKPYSVNIPDNSIFSEHYDVDSYLRRNLNFNISNKYEAPKENNYDIENIGNKVESSSNKLVVRKGIVNTKGERDEKKPSIVEEDTLPIPVLRHSPKTTVELNANNKVSDAMKLVEDKWKVPAVQKNILKSAPNEEGKSVSILTQLGSIRRQLQLEQLKLDEMLSKDAV